MDEQGRDLSRAAFGAGRASAPRLAVARAAAAMRGAFTVEDLERTAASDGTPAGTATVYRAVAAMAASGFLEQVGERDGAALYARCEVRGHHHHLVCTSCGSVEHAPCPVGRDLIEHAGARGFVITSHDVTIYGMCATCLGAGAGR